MNNTKNNTYNIDNFMNCHDDIYHCITPRNTSVTLEAVPVSETQYFIDQNKELQKNMRINLDVEYAKAGAYAIIAKNYNDICNNIAIPLNKVTNLINWDKTEKERIEFAAKVWVTYAVKPLKSIEYLSNNVKFWIKVSNEMDSDEINPYLIRYCKQFGNISPDELRQKSKEAVQFFIKYKKLTMIRNIFTQILFIVGLDSFKVGSLGYRMLVENGIFFAKNQKNAADARKVPDIELNDITRLAYYPCSVDAINHYNEIVSANNMKINEFRQSTGTKVPLLKTLYKLPGSAGECDNSNTITNDAGVINALDTLAEIHAGTEKLLNTIVNMIDTNPSNIYVSAETKYIARNVLKCESLTIIDSNLDEKIRAENPQLPKESKKKWESRISDIKKSPLSLPEYIELANGENSVKQFSDYVLTAATNFSNAIAALQPIRDRKWGDTQLIPTEDYNAEKALIQTATSAGCALLRTLKNFEFTEDDMPGGEDIAFHDILSNAISVLDEIPRLTALIMRYAISSIDSNISHRFTAGRPTFLCGFDANKCTQNGNFILRIKDEMYIAIAPEGVNVDMPLIDTESVCKFYYCHQYDAVRQIPRMFIKSSNYINNPNNVWVTDKIREYIENDAYKTLVTDNGDVRITMINYFKECLLHAHYDIGELADASAYKSLAAFYGDVSEKLCTKEYVNVDHDQIMKLVRNGTLYLFKLTTVNLSPTGKSHMNVNSLISLTAFNPDTMGDPRFKIAPGQFIFHEAKNKNPYVTHAAGTFVPNKTNNGGHVFDFDLIDHASHYRDKYTFTFLYQLNHTAKDNVTALNDMVMAEYRDGKFDHIIGIDRGERNLAYLTVTNIKTHKIVYQKSLNTINGVNYAERMKSLDNYDKKSQKSWGTRKKIANLMDGWTSFAVYEIVRLMLEYNAIIALEYLNPAFCKQRKAMCRTSVYKKLQDALVSKLNFIVPSKHDHKAILNAFQFSNGHLDDKYNRTQNGVIFYVDPKYTSNNDVTTGFITQFMKTAADTNAQANDVIEQFDDISYDKDLDTLVLSYDGTDMYMTGKRMIYNQKTHSSSEVDLSDIAHTMCNNIGVEMEKISKSVLLNASLNSRKEFARMIRLAKYMRFSRGDEDDIYSIVKGPQGKFFSTADLIAGLPENADANGSYCISLKAINRLESPDLKWTEFLKENAAIIMHA